MLTTRQILTIAMRQPEPPWSFQELRNDLDISPLSTRAVVAGISKQRLTFWLPVTDKMPDWTKVKDKDSLIQFILTAPAPSKQTLVKLSDQLQPIEVSLALSKKTWKVVGFSGTANALSQLGAADVMDVVDGIRDVSAGVGIAGGAILGVLALPLTPIVILVGGGMAIAGGALIGLGAYEIEDAPKPKPSADLENGDDGIVPPDQLDFPDDSIGEAPPDVVAAGDNVDDFLLGPGAVDLLPDWGPVAPPDTPGPPGVGDDDGSIDIPV